MVKKVFKKEHIGMKVYFISGEAGVIVDYTEADMYPVKVSFNKDTTNTMRFTADGKTFQDDKLPSLSFVPWHPPEGWDEPPIQKDTLLWVRDSDNEQWKPRYFAGWDGDIVMCYADGRTSKTEIHKNPVKWRHWKIYKEDKRR